MARKDEFVAPHSRIKADIADILKEEGYNGLTVTVTDNTNIKVEGIDKQLVGQFASDVRAYYPPEPYKGKGVRYVGEYVRRKAGTTLLSASTADKGASKSACANIASAADIGKKVAEKAKAANIEQVVFDRGGFFFHGKVKALADAAREAGLQF
ncbi:UNVERIFIED_CONTAM: hypothetical protein GTU68_036013 [Idotea baltica]|nr:hypothetical protein [Idotea baltica]